MIAERDVDAGAVYERVRRDLLALVRSLDDGALALRVPATPAWTVKDVVAHLVGIDADLNAGRFPAAGVGARDAWTAEQVHVRRDRTVAELEAEWEQEAPTFEDGLRLFGYEVGSHYVGDLLQHATDVRATVREPRSGDAEALAVALDFYLDSCHQTLGGAVTVSVGDAEWTLGPPPAVASLTTDRFELFRALGGRRSEAQLRALAWTGDVDAIVPVLSRYPLPAHDLED